MISEDAFHLIGACQFDDAVAVRAAVDEVADLNDTILFLQFERIEELLKFIGTAVNVSYGNGSGHEFEGVFRSSSWKGFGHLI